MTLATYLLGWALKALGLALLLDAKCVTCKRTSLEFGQRPASASQLMQRRFSTQSAPQFFNQLRSRVNVTPLRWRVLRHFELLQTQPDPDCSNVGVRFPHLVSRNKSVLDAFKSYACGEGAGYFVTDPSIALTATMAELREGCVNLQPWPEMMQAANATHGEYIYRSCNANCSMREGKSIRPLIVDEDLLVVSSLRVWPGMPYQHALLDMLAPVWSVVQDTAFQNSSVKIVVNHPLHVSMLKSLGVPEDRIFEIKFGSFQRDSPKLLLCTKQTLHLWRAGGPLGEILPTLQYGDGRMYSDFWHRLINWQVGLKISDKMMQEAGMQDKLMPARVIFLQRCSDKRKIANEQDALGLTSSVLVRSNRSELLTSFCGGREDLLEQMWEMRGASLVLGQHGGALANILFAPQDAGIVEFVGSPAAHKGLPGVWPPYKSYWYGGAGAAFKFFRVVLYDLDSHGAWQLRLEDLEEALQQWTDHNTGTMRPM